MNLGKIFLMATAVDKFATSATARGALAARLLVCVNCEKIQFLQGGGGLYNSSSIVNFAPTCCGNFPGTVPRDSADLRDYIFLALADIISSMTMRRLALRHFHT